MHAGPQAALSCFLKKAPRPAWTCAARPGTRETDLLNPVNTVQQVQAILLTGGSAFGLDAATGVVRYLEERGSGITRAQMSFRLFRRPYCSIWEWVIQRSDRTQFQATRRARQPRQARWKKGMSAPARVRPWVRCSEASRR